MNPSLGVGERHTSIVVERTLVKPKAAFAGVIFEISLARLEHSMARFNVETTPSRSFGYWEPVAIVETRGSSASREEAASDTACGEEAEP